MIYSNDVFDVGDYVKQKVYIALRKKYAWLILKLLNVCSKDKLLI